MNNNSLKDHLTRKNQPNISNAYFTIYSKENIRGKLINKLYNPLWDNINNSLLSLLTLDLQTLHSINENNLIRNYSQ